MGFEQFTPHPEDKEGKKQKKTTLYKPFEKKEQREKIRGIQIDEEKEEEVFELENLERNLKEGEEKNEKLLQRLKSLEKILKANKLWTKVEVAGEEHTIAFSHLEQKEEPITPSEVIKQAEKDEYVLSRTMISFRLKKTEGRTEHLFLSFKTPLITFLQGGGKIEQELQKLVTQQFAGTKHYYSTLQEKQEQQQREPHDTEVFEIEKKQIKGALQKNGAEISEAEGAEKNHFIMSFIASFPGTNKQIHISTIDKKSWNVVKVKDQKIKKEIFNLRAQEVISYALEKTL